MQMIEVIFLIIGLTFIVVSFFLTDRGRSSKEDAEYIKKLEEKIVNGGVMERMAVSLKEQVKEQIDELVDSAVVQTDDQLSQASNEKIIELSEYSDQVLEKINLNHTEVVFLYDMLNEKEKDLKDFGRKIEGMKQEMAEATAQVRARNKQAAAVQKAVLKASEPETAEIVLKQKVEERKPSLPAAVQTSAEELKIKRSLQTAPADTAAAGREQVKEDQKTRGTGTVDESFANSNEHILALHSQGKSIVEISKILGLGQGEVKLVIDLFKDV